MGRPSVPHSRLGLCRFLPKMAGLRCSAGIKKKRKKADFASSSSPSNGYINPPPGERRAWHRYLAEFKPHSSGEETLWHNGRTCPVSGLHCGIGSHCLTDSCRKNEEEEEETRRTRHTCLFWGERKTS